MATLFNPQQRACAGGQRRSFRLVGMMVLLWLSLSASPALAQPALDVRVGFHGQFVPDQHVPIHIQVTYQGPAVSAELVLRQETRRPLYSTPQAFELRRTVQLSQRARQLHVFYFPLSVYPAPDAEEPQLVVRLLSQGEEIASQRLGLLDAVRSDPFVLAVSDVGVPSVLPTGERIEQVGVDELPLDWKGYAGVRRLYLGRFTASALLLEQQQALQQWLTRGGELVVLTGENFYLQDVPWLRQILPFEFREVRRVEELGAAVALGTARGQVLHEAGGIPLLVRGRFAQGTIYVSTVDLLGPERNLRPIWEILRPETTELPLPSRLGRELFQQMELQFPPKLVMAVLAALYVAGFGLLSLWVLRRPGWLEAGSGWRVLVLSGIWMGLFTGWILVDLQPQEFTRRAQSLEIGFIRGSDQSPWAFFQGWYGMFPKREVALELPLSRDSLVLPQEQSDLVLQLQADRTQVRFSSMPLLAWRPQYLYVEELVPLQIQIQVDEDLPGVRTPVVRVYNASRWWLKDAVLVQNGIYYPLGDVPPGRAREVALDDRGAASWLTARGSPPDGWEERVKRRLHSELQSRVAQRAAPHVLLAWVSEAGWPAHPQENRSTLKLLYIEST
jgi:hypothetical protein